ncbi:hypothetical protein AB9L18_17955 [Stenotrophomonas lactitubi]
MNAGKQPPPCTPRITRFSPAINRARTTVDLRRHPAVALPSSPWNTIMANQQNRHPGKEQQGKTPQDQQRQQQQQQQPNEQQKKNPQQGSMKNPQQR